MTQKQRIGASKGAGRICLWNRAMIGHGFPIGQRITIKQTGARFTITPDDNGARKVSGVMNHGNRLPVIDLKQTKSLDVGSLGEVGDVVTVKIARNKITITKEKQ